MSESAPAPQGSRMLGFGKALTSTILGFFAFAFSILALAILTEYNYFEDVVTACILNVIAIAMGVVSVVLGTGSIKVFKKANPKPIATLILGISGLVQGVIALMYSFLSFMIALSTSI